MKNLPSLLLSLFGSLLVTVTAAKAAVTLGPDGQAAYKAHLARATTLVEQGKVEEAVAEAKAARTLNPKGYEAPATLALILQAAGKHQEAAAAIADALKLAPTEARPRVEAIAKMVGPQATTQPVATATPAVEKKPSNALTGAARRKYDTLLLSVTEADQAKSSGERQKLLREFMSKSAEFILENRSVTNVWVLRAAAALELDYPGSGWLAGKWLKEAGADETDAPNIRKIMVLLDRKGWLGAKREWRDWSKYKPEQVRQLAEVGDEEAQVAIGLCYQDGKWGLPKDDPQASIWFRKAAEQGSALAQELLCYCYEDGRGVPQDTKEAASWARKAASQGSPDSQRNVGVFYDRLATLLAASPRPEKRNGKEAVEWAIKACEISQWTNNSYVDTLAAAYAEAGDFRQAVKYGQMAIKLTDLTKDSEFLKELQDRLKLYEAGQPYRLKE